MFLVFTDSIQRCIENINKFIELERKAPSVAYCNKCNKYLCTDCKEAHLRIHKGNIFILNNKINFVRINQ